MRGGNLICFGLTEIVAEDDGDEAGVDGGGGGISTSLSYTFKFKGSSMGNQYQNISTEMSIFFFTICHSAALKEIFK